MSTQPSDRGRYLAITRRNAESEYTKLRALDIGAFRECMASAAVLQLQHGMSLETAAAIERALVTATLRGWEIKR